MLIHGVHVALSSSQAGELLGAEADPTKLIELVNQFEEHSGDANKRETVYAWSTIHQCLALAGTNADNTPHNGPDWTELGGRRLATWTDASVFFSNVAETETLSKIINTIDKVEFKRRYEIANTNTQPSYVTAEDFEFTWTKFESLKALYNSAVLAKQPILTHTFTPRYLLLLSGGGFRATLFHLGVVLELTVRGMLDSVCAIVAISGGSILASLLATKWPRLLSISSRANNPTSKDVFRTIEKDYWDEMADLRSLIGWDLRGKVFRTWLALNLVLFPLRMIAAVCQRLPLLNRLLAGCLWVLRKVGVYRPLSRGALFASFYDRRLFQILDDKTNQVRGAVLNDLRKVSIPVCLCSCDYRTGNLCWAGKNGFYELVLSITDSGGLVGPRSYACDSVPLGTAVYASAAFPPILPPCIIKPTDATVPLVLGDGGMWDNLGYHAADIIRRYDCLGKLPDRVGAILSNAELGMAAERVNREWWLSDRALRIPDILMNRMSTESLGRFQAGRNENSLEFDEFIHVALDPRYYFRYGSARSDRWEALASLRTDLDRFDDMECEALISAGRSLSEWAFSAPSPHLPSGLAETDGSDVDWLRRGSKRRWRLFANEWTTYLTLVVGTLYLAGIALGIFVWTRAPNLESLNGVNLLAGHSIGYQAYGKGDSGRYVLDNPSPGRESALVDSNLSSGIEIKLDVQDAGLIENNIRKCPRLAVHSQDLSSVNVRIVRIYMTARDMDESWEPYVALTWKSGETSKSWSNTYKVTDRRMLSDGMLVYEFSFNEPQPMQELLVYILAASIGPKAPSEAEANISVNEIRALKE